MYILQGLLLNANLGCKTKNICSLVAFVSTKLLKNIFSEFHLRYISLHLSVKFARFQMGKFLKIISEVRDYVSTKKTNQRHKSRHDVRARKYGKSMPNFLSLSKERLKYWVSNDVLEVVT